MDPALKRRLDVLVVLCAAILGVAVAAAVTAGPIGPGILAVSLLPTFIVLVLAYAYVDRAGTPRQSRHEPGG